MTPQKWTLLNQKDVSVSKWFPIEQRTYQLPNGSIVDDFTVTTLADVAMIVPITKAKKVVFVNQFKPGVGEVIIQFPAGRLESHHQNLSEVAQHELAEETGINMALEQFQPFATLSGFSTKASEKVFFFLVTDCETNTAQKLDVTENIEVLQLSMNEVDEYILSGKIWCAQTIAGWEIAKKKFSLST